MKKSRILVLAAILQVFSMTTTSFANSPKIISQEGIGINVYSPIPLVTKQQKNIPAINLRSIIEGEEVSVSGGTLWATWRNGIDFRANYDHDTKVHRSTAMNDHNTAYRSDWVKAKVTAISPWVDQTLWGNRVFAATE